jgi:DNA-binding transcriptional LysR family regulator
MARLDSPERQRTPPAAPPGDAFDPATTRQHFRLGTPDYLAPPLMAAVVQYMREHAPGAQLTLQPLGAGFDHETALADGDLDVVIGNWPQPPEQLRSSLLFADEIVCLVDRDHRCAQGMRCADFLQGAHVVPLLYSQAQNGVIEKHLAAHRMRRPVAVTVPYFSMAPHLLAGTDLIFTTSRHFAEHFAAMLPLAVVRAPIDFPAMRFYQLWHAGTLHAQGQVWFRALLSAVVRTARATQCVRLPAQTARDPATPRSA